MFKTIKTFFEKNEDKRQREIKELLRENLSLIPIDIFYIDDPIMGLNEEQKYKYYKKFFDIVSDKEVMERIKFLINKQARLTLASSRDGTADAMGASCINGIASVKDDFERLANSYIKESAPKEDFNKYKII